MTIVVQRKAPALAGRARPSWSASASIAVAACYAGPVEEGERVVRPLKEFGSPGARPVRAQAVPGAPADVRSRRSGTAGGTTSGRATSPSSATTSSTSWSSTASGSRRRSPASPCGRWAARSPGSARTRPRSTAATPASPSTSTATAETAEGFEAERQWARDYWSALAPAPHQRLRELPHGGGRGAGPAGLRRREVRPAEGAQAHLRPDELLPPQPEHPARGRYASSSADGTTSNEGGAQVSTTTTVTTLDGGSTSISEEVLAELRGKVRGSVIVPGDAGYDDVDDVFNGMLPEPSRPGRALLGDRRCRRRGQLRPRARPGGGRARRRALDRRAVVQRRGHADRPVADGGVQVDPERRLAYVQGGALWGDVDREKPGVRAGHAGRGGLRHGRRRA